MAEETKKYISLLNGYHIRDVEAQLAAAAAKSAADAAQAAADAAQDTADEAKQTANDAYSLAQARNKAKVYDTFRDLIEDLYHIQEGDATDDTYDKAFAVGTNLLIKTMGCPDYWVTKVHMADVEHSATDDEQFISQLEREGWVRETIEFEDDPGWKPVIWHKWPGDISGHYPEYFIGRAKISILESEKIDVTEFVYRDDYNDYKAGVANGKIVVGKATNATNATNAANAEHATTADSATYATNASNAINATNDGAGRNIQGTYATKDALKAEKITIKVTGENMQILKNGVELVPTNS